VWARGYFAAVVFVGEVVALALLDDSDFEPELPESVEEDDLLSLALEALPPEPEPEPPLELE
jgi:hypothetical protein